MAKSKMSASQRYSGKSFKSSLKAFGLGKLISASLGLVNFSFLTRALLVGEYGNYVAIFAAIELGLFFSIIGIDWVAVRYIPQFRAKGDDRLLARFIGAILAIRFGQLLLLATLFYSLLPYFSTLGLPGNWHAYSLYICMIVAFEGAARFIREFLFESLLLQKYSQISLVARSSIVTIGLIWIVKSGSNNLDNVLIIESAAVLISFVVTSVMLAMFVSSLRNGGQSQEKLTSYKDEFLKCATHNYLSGVFAYLGSGQMMLLAIARFLGAEAAAMFGYARYLIEFVRRYLPGELLNGLIRPKLIADYAVNKNFHSLNVNTKIIFKLNSVVLAFCLLSLLVSGKELLSILSGSKFNGALPLLLFMCATLIPFCHRRLLETVANALDLASLWSRTSFVLSFGVPAAIVGMYFGGGIYSAILSIFVAEICANALLIGGMRKLGFEYDAGIYGVAKLAFLMLISFGVVWLLFGSTGVLLTHWLIQLGLGVVSFMGLLIFYSPFPVEERRYMLAFVGR